MTFVPKIQQSDSELLDSTWTYFSQTLEILKKKKQSLIELSFSMLTLGLFGVFLGILAIVVMQYVVTTVSTVTTWYTFCRFQSLVFSIITNNGLLQTTTVQKHFQEFSFKIRLREQCV